jgi:excisionase family DNA binding protein
MENNQDFYPSTVLLEPLFTASEVAHILHVSRSYAYLLMQSRHIPTVRLGRSIRVRPKDLVDYIEANIHCHVDTI